jgi:hypothetical protein
MKWRPIPRFPGYEVSDRGVVRHVDSKKWIAPVANQGHMRVRLFLQGGGWRDRRVNVIVLEAFVGPRPSPRHHASHTPDRDKANNRLDNLKWRLRRPSSTKGKTHDDDGE